MHSTTLKELEWVHDCTLVDILYDAEGSDGHSIKITMRCPMDLGYAPWNGKNIVLIVTDVAASKHIVRGFVTGQELIDSIRPGVSATVRESTVEAGRAGVRIPDLEFTISFHSGSVLEVICKELQIAVGV